MAKHDSLISVEKRILFHLLNHYSSKHRYEAPIDLTQIGIAHAVGTSQSHTSRSIKKLVNKKLVSERIGRVKLGKKKQKYYQLTDEGKGQAGELKKKLSNLEITLKHPAGPSRMMKLKDIIPFLGKEGICSGITDLDIYICTSKECTLDIESLKKIEKTQFIDFSADAPRVLHFFGRKKELAILERWVKDVEEHNIIFIHGMAGIGKTTLAAKLIEGYRGSKHLFWYNFTDLGTLRGALLKLAEFLSELWHDHLELYLRTRKSLDYDEVSKILRKSIGAIDAVLIFDDFHKTNEQIRAFFVCFPRILSSSSKTKMLILSREMVPFYDERDVFIKKIVAELELEGLDFESSKRLLKGKGIDKRMFENIYELTSGNPFFLEASELKDHLEKYMHDELFLKLEEDERKLLGLLSIYHFPVPEESLAMNDDFDFERLYVLTQKSIVKKDAYDRYFVHDIIKQFFYTRLSHSKRRKHHLLAARWYGNRDEPIDLIEAIYHFQEAGKHKKASQFAIDSSTSILDGGYASEFLPILERFDEKNLETRVWAEILIVKGKACNTVGEWKKALLYFTQSDDIATIIGDKKLEVKAICESGHIFEEQNQFDEAMKCFKKCLDISKGVDHLSGIGEGYRGIGRVYWRRSEHEKAIVNYKKCLEISERLGDLELMASTYIDMGNVYDERYETEMAIDYYNKSLDILKKVKNT
jgi:tetratricopeptide (TPR) repeat protein/DNA-binding MarR family transcriptional regulator